MEGFTLALSGSGPNKVITIDVDDALASSIDQLALITTLTKTFIRLSLMATTRLSLISMRSTVRA